MKQLFSLWADPLVLEYFKSTKSRELSHCSYYAEWTSHKPVLHKGPLCQGYQKCAPHSWTRTHNILEQFVVCTKSEATRCWKKQPNLDGTCSLLTAGHSLPWNISGNQKQTLPLNTVMAFTWKEMHSYWKVWASLWVDEGCLLWCSSVCFCTMPMVSVPLLNKLLGASLLGHRDSASNIYSMEKYNVTIIWLVNTKDIPDLTKWLDWILNSLIQHLESLSYPSSHQAEGEWLDWLDALSFSFL